MRPITIKERIRASFFVSPTARRRVRQIERKLTLPLPSVIRYCKELEQEGILKKEELAGVTAYSADRASRQYVMEKRLFNLKSLFVSGLVDHLAHEYSNPPVAVFGSYARGEDVEDSDVYLYIETPKKYVFHLERFERDLHRKIQVFNYKRLKDVPNVHLANNI